MCKTCIKNSKILIAYDILYSAHKTISNLDDELLENYDIANLIESLNKQINYIKNKK